MTVAFESGYTLPGGDLPLNHARILHDGNRFPIKTVTASAEVANYAGANANRGDTVDRWRPFANGLTSPSDFSDAAWTASLLSVGSDGQTINEGTGTGTPDLEQAFTFTAAEYVFGVIVERQTIDLIRLVMNDGSTDFEFADFNLHAVTASGDGEIIALGGNRYLCRTFGTATSGTGSVRIVTYDGTPGSYTGTGRTVKVEAAICHLSSASLRMDTFAAAAGDVMCIAAHNLWSGGGRITFEHDSNADDTFTSIGSVEPTDNSPIMFIFEPITSARWRITVDRGVLPEIGVFRIGDALQMERPFYGGFSPSRMARNTEVIGNISGSGELLGRSKKRTTLTGSYQWQNLTYAWVRANLDGPRGLIQAMEAEPCFIAWRPSVTQDVDYVMRGQATPPQAQGTRDLWSFSMSGEVRAYE